MARFGLEEELVNAPTEEEVEEPAYDIWEESIPAINLFLSLENHWDILVSPDGELIRTNIRTQAIEFKLKYKNGIAKKDWAKLIEQLEWMERSALVVMNKLRGERTEKRARELE